MAMKISYGDIKVYPKEVEEFITYWYSVTEPESVHICDGSAEEKKFLVEKLLASKTIIPLKKYQDCYLARTDPEDVARVAGKTFMCTPEMATSVTVPKAPCTDKIGNWKNDKEMREILNAQFKGCMHGRTMFVLPFSMGPLGSNISKVGVELTDSAYVTVSMGIMTTMGKAVIPHIDAQGFIKCVHSVGAPLKMVDGKYEEDKPWPCNPPKTLITQFPATNEIISFGSGYGGNSLLGKKCFALRIASNLAKKEGWLAEHMLIMGLESPEKKKIYIAAAFPSACGKTNLAMLTPSLPGWKVTCVGDDIAWMKFDSEGALRAVNPEHGFFGVAPGTNTKSNPVAMSIIKKDTVFFFFFETSDGGVFWEGLEEETDFATLKFVDWRNKEWTQAMNTPSSHPNSRFCSPVTNCPILDEAWEDPKGVPISAIIFGGRRPEGVPLIYESMSWEHGVLVGASVKSETTSAEQDNKKKTIVHDPFAMRPFFGYNCGDYFQHWLDVGAVAGRKLPKVYHANWFLKDEKGNYLWPGFGENCRVLKWIHERSQGTGKGVTTPIGIIPSTEAFDLSGLSGINAEKLFEVKKSFWKEELSENRKFFENVIYKQFPEVLNKELEKMEKSVEEMPA